MPGGRPKKYFTEEARTQANRDSSARHYQKKKTELSVTVHSQTTSSHSASTMKENWTEKQPPFRNPQDIALEALTLSANTLIVEPTYHSFKAVSSPLTQPIPRNAYEEKQAAPPKFRTIAPKANCSRPLLERTPNPSVPTLPKSVTSDSLTERNVLRQLANVEKTTTKFAGIVFSESENSAGHMNHGLHMDHHL